MDKGARTQTHWLVSYGNVGHTYAVECLPSLDEAIEYARATFELPATKVRYLRKQLISSGAGTLSLRGAADGAHWVAIEGVDTCGLHDEA